MEGYSTSQGKRLGRFEDVTIIVEGKGESQQS